MQDRSNILETWDISAEDLTAIVRENPSLRGMILGYIAERKLRDYFENDSRVSAIRKDDDHDRRKKGDLIVSYKGRTFVIEVKSLQTNTIEILVDSSSQEWVRKIIRCDRTSVENEAYASIWNNRKLSLNYRGKIQCDASDRRTITLPNKKTIETTNLLVGEFDVLAAGLFAFRERWEFGFALNRDLPRSTHGKYPPRVRQRLLKSLVPVAWPLERPFVIDPFPLFEKLIRERRRTKS